MRVPSINGPRGLFDVFVPGIFLILNIGLFLFRLKEYDNGQSFEFLKDSETIIIAVVISGGYLAGAILRMLKTRMADKCSARFLRILRHFSKKQNVQCNPPKQGPKPLDRTLDDFQHGYCQDFPYVEWLCTSIAKNLGPDVENFVREHWSRLKAPKIDTSFVSHWKTLLALKHPSLYVELLAEEALVRFVASMFYALIISNVLLIGSLCLAVHASSIMLAIEPALISIYSLAILGILINFRHLRCKEAVTFLSACYAAHIYAEVRASGISLPSHNATDNESD